MYIENMFEVNKGGVGLVEKEWQEKLVMMLVRNLARPHCSLLVVHTAQLQGQSKLLLMTWCQILCTMRLQCVSKILTPRRMLKKTSLIAKINLWTNSF